MTFSECPASNRRSTNNNVVMLNMDMVKDLKTVSESKDRGPDQPPSLNIQRLNSRTNTNIDRKKRQIRAFKAGVSPDGHKVFQAIIKTLDDCDWRGDDIVVMGKVTIAAPYKPENVKGVRDSQAFTHVRKIVSKVSPYQKKIVIHRFFVVGRKSLGRQTARAGGGHRSLLGRQLAGLAPLVRVRNAGDHTRVAHHRVQQQRGLLPRQSQPPAAPAAAPPGGQRGRPREGKERAVVEGRRGRRWRRAQLSEASVFHAVEKPSA